MDALYKVLTGRPIIPDPEDILTIMPDFYLIITGKAALVAAICESKFVFIIVSQTSKSKSLNSSLIEVPPLLIRMSTLCSLKVSVSIFSTSFGLLRSIYMQITLSGAPDSFLTLSSSFNRLAPIITLLAPNAINILQRHSPIPDDPPEMNTTLFKNYGLQLIHNYLLIKWYTTKTTTTSVAI